MRAGLAIQTKSAYAAIQKIKGLKPAKAGFVCVAANSIRQVQDVSYQKFTGTDNIVWNRIIYICSFI